jgi:asparagine synthase (glutamine-hydrolysing)
MCGYLGIKNNSKRNDLKKFLYSLGHRGPDEANYYEKEGISIIHNRLAIIDPKGGKQPMISSEGNILSYNGEIYNFKEIQTQKNFTNTKFNSDTELLFYLLNTIGVEKTCALIDGMFSFFYYDKKNDMSYLCRDISGQKPLYYSYQNNELIFSSEINPIVKIKNTNNLNLNNIKKYLIIDYFPGEQTLFDNIKKILPGYIYKFKNGKVDKVNFSQNIIENKKKYTTDNLITLDNILNDSVKKTLISDAPIGILLSGGLDSSIITGIAKKYDSNIPTFSASFVNKTYDESEYIEFIVKNLGIKNYLYKFTELDLKNSINQFLEYLDEPFADPSMISTFLLCKFTREKVKVALTGDGSDELFAGYPNFKIARFARLIEIFPATGAKILKKISENLNITKNYMNLQYLIKQFAKGLGKKRSLQTNFFMSTFSENEIEKLFNQEYNENEIFSEFLNIKNETFTNDYILELQKNFFSFYLPENILFKSDRSSMYNSLELRSPFLSNDIINFAFNLESKNKVNFFKTKHILKKVSEKYIPKKISERKKHGFAVPLNSLIENYYYEFREEILENKFLNFLDKKILEKILSSDKKNIYNNSKKIWSLFILSKVLKKYN